MQVSSALITFIAMDMEVVMMVGNVIVTMTGVVNLIVQVIYQAHLLIYVYVIWGCSMTMWTKGDGYAVQKF